MLPLTPYIKRGIYATLQPAEKDVLNILLFRAHRKSWVAWPSHALIAKDTGLHERSVKRGLDGLVKRGLIEIMRNGFLDEQPEKKATGKGGGKYVYRIKDIENGE